MYNQQVATVFGFLAMSFVVLSYFLKSKSGYLLFQLLNMFCFAISYLFCENFFAMIGLTISAVRTFVFYLYEIKKSFSFLIPITLSCILFLNTIDQCPIYMLFWMFIPIIFILMLPVLFGALLSIVAMYITRFLKTRDICIKMINHVTQNKIILI